MRRSALYAALSLAVIALAGPALAGGFRIPEQGAAAMGLANAFVGQADDPSAVQFNPAGMVQLPGNQIELGGTSITVQSEYARGVTTARMKDTVAVPPNLYYTGHLGGESPWWVGFGVTSPFGLSSEWDVANFKYILTKTNLEMVKLNPAVAYRASDRLSAAVGVDYYNVMEASFENDAMLPGPTPAYQTMSGEGTGYGYNLGVLYRASDDLSLGFAYRSGTTVELEGDLNFTIDATGSSAPGYPRAVNLDLNLPATAALGVSWKAAEKWRLNLDLDWTGWSAYDKLEIRDAASGVVIRTIPKDYEDTTAVRVGAEYAINESWDLRCGFLLDSTPVPTETYDGRMPDGDRWAASLGAGWKKGGWGVDFAYMYVKVQEYNVDNAVTSAFGIPGQTVDGSYEGSINLIALDLTYRF